MDPKSPNGFRKNHLNQTDQTFKVPENLHFSGCTIPNHSPTPQNFPPTRNTPPTSNRCHVLFLPKSHGFFASSKVNNWPVGESQPFGWSACDGKHMTSEKRVVWKFFKRWLVNPDLSGILFLVNKTKTNQRSRTHLKIYGIKQESYDLNK